MCVGTNKCKFNLPCINPTAQMESQIPPLSLGGSNLHSITLSLVSFNDLTPVNDGCSNGSTSPWSSGSDSVSKTQWSAPYWIRRRWWRWFRLSLLLAAGPKRFQWPSAARILLLARHHGRLHQPLQRLRFHFRGWCNGLRRRGHSKTVQQFSVWTGEAPAENKNTNDRFATQKRLLTATQVQQKQTVAVIAV